MDQLLLAEYKSLTDEVKSLMVEVRQLEIYCAGAVFAIYSWFFSSGVEHNLAWIFPVLIPILGILRSWAFYYRIRQISVYIKTIESQYLSDFPQICGWENHYATIRNHGLTPTAILYWLVLMALCIFLPVIILK